MIRKAIKKPIEIEYMTYEEARKQRNHYDSLNWQGQERGNGTYIQKYSLRETHIVINTLEGNMKMTDKDVLIIGVRGEIYPCKIDIFHETYEVIK